MPDYKKRVQVIQINPDMDQVTGERYTQVTLGFETSAAPSQMSTPRLPYWKYSLYLFIPNSSWKDQYRMWQEYEMVVKETGEMTLKPIEVDS